MAVTRSDHNELFFVALVAVVVLGAFVVIMRYSDETANVVPQVEGVGAGQSDSTQDMLNVLDRTTWEDSSADFVQLRNDASGL